MHNLSLDQLAILFVNDRLPQVIKSEFGQGSMRLIDLEQGLQVRYWNCWLKDALELTLYSSEPDECYHLIFFLELTDVRFVTDHNTQRDSIWDTLFFSSRSNFRIVVPSSSTIQSLSMSFSKRWLNKNLSKGDQAVRTILAKLITDPAFCKVGCMNLAEKRNVAELSTMVINGGVASFYIKSNVLKIVGDFFLTLIEDKALDTVFASGYIPFDEIEKYLDDHLNSFRSTKEIADHFSISRTTLKRLFKNKYGISPAAFVTSKRMELAKGCVDAQQKTLHEVARMLGYKNVRNFIARYRKYFKIEA